MIGAVSSFAALQYDNSWLILGGLLAVVALILSSYWADRDHGPGITTEAAAVLTFLLGVVIMRGASELAIALAILALAVLFPKQQIKRFRSRVKTHEMRAVVLFLTITFIVLPVLPRQSLDSYLSFPVGAVTDVDAEQGWLYLEVLSEREVEPGDQLDLVTKGWERLGTVEITGVIGREAVGIYRGEEMVQVKPGLAVRERLGIEFLEVMLSALKPYKIWLIVVLVSLISFVGYALIKVIGSGAGIGLTGLIGGLVSSTVTTLSFARRSKENPDANPLFAMAVLLASSVMFPRLILEIAVVNQDMMRNIAVPLGVMGGTGFVLAYLLYRRSREQSGGETSVSFDNPFSLKSAVTFGLVFAAILMVTRLATTYLGTQWLPAVAVVSGLTDADAIAFSLSNLEHAGLVSLDWASFNLVLGALSNTFMKLFLVFGLGHRVLFKQLLVSFLVVGVVGIVTMFFYYDLSSRV
jgi:uncharacterized membrane protein (DUF4010 family)